MKIGSFSEQLPTLSTSPPEERERFSVQKKIFFFCSHPTLISVPHYSGYYARITVFGLKDLMKHFGSSLTNDTT
jgi:hypothetical protein